MTWCWVELVGAGVRKRMGLDLGMELGLGSGQSRDRMRLGSGSARELKLGTRPGSHLLVAHQVDLDVR